MASSTASPPRKDPNPTVRWSVASASGANGQRSGGPSSATTERAVAAARARAVPVPEQQVPPGRGLPPVHDDAQRVDGDLCAIGVQMGDRVRVSRGKGGLETGGARGRGVRSQAAFVFLNDPGWRGGRARLR